MKKLILTIMLVGFSIAAFSQANNADYLRYKRVYEQALKYSDYPAAKNALYNMLAVNPENDSVRYALALYYLDAKNYPSCLMVCMDILEKHPNDLVVIEAMAVSYEKLGLKAKSVESYEKLYLLTNNVAALYKAAYFQFDLKRFDECKTNIDILLTRKEEDQEKLVFSFTENKQEEFPMRVSILNLKGALLKEQGDMEGARKAFEEALAVSPNFKIAKDNLEKLN